MVDEVLNDDEIYSMYNDLDPKENKAPAKAYQKLAGLKLSGTHEHVLEYDGKNIRVANPEYVRLLELRVQELNREIKTLKNYVRKLANHYNKLVEDLAKLDNNTIKRDKSA